MLTRSPPWPEIRPAQDVAKFWLEQKWQVVFCFPGLLGGRGVASAKLLSDPLVFPSSGQKNSYFGVWGNHSAACHELVRDGSTFIRIDARYPPRLRFSTR